MHFDWLLFFTEFPKFVFMTTGRCPWKDKTVNSSKKYRSYVSFVATETQKMSSLTFESVTLHVLDSTGVLLKLYAVA